jgi:histidinol-phosphate aminotransferase
MLMVDGPVLSTLVSPPLPPPPPPPAAAAAEPAAGAGTQVGCGADELIDLLMRCVLDPGDKIVDCPPTFTMYAFDADVNDAVTVTVPRLEGFALDVPGIK